MAKGIILNEAQQELVRKFTHELYVLSFETYMLRFGYGAYLIVQAIRKNTPDGLTPIELSRTIPLTRTTIERRIKKMVEADWLNETTHLRYVLTDTHKDETNTYRQWLHDSLSTISFELQDLK